MTTTLTSSKTAPLSGTATIPGDKSISHRALIMGGLAIGETIISGLLEGEDVLCTVAAMRAMGAKVEKREDGTWHCHGVGIGGLHEPECALEMGNSGTSVRLLMGLVGGHHITATFTGDPSLSKRPMKRVITPLEMMGIQISAREGGKLPLTTKGPKTALPIEYRLPVASAQVKSAVLLAGLSAPGQTNVIEEKPTRDYTEKMLRHFGVPVEIETLEDGAQAIRVTGQQDLMAAPVSVPADPSSAAFPAIAAILVEGSDILLPNVGMNPRRNGLYTTLIEMGADIAFENKREEAGEPISNLHIKGIGPLKGIDIPASRVPSMIDEFPVLAMAAACAQGTTTMTGLAELRVKESDRLLMVTKGLKACGVTLEMGEDSLTIHGMGKPPQGEATIETALDHRIAMSFLVLGTVTKEPIKIDNAFPIATSFPTFTNLMNTLGTDIR